MNKLCSNYDGLQTEAGRLADKNVAEMRRIMRSRALPRCVVSYAPQCILISAAHAGGLVKLRLGMRAAQTTRRQHGAQNQKDTGKCTASCPARPMSLAADVKYQRTCDSTQA